MSNEKEILVRVTELATSNAPKGNFVQHGREIWEAFELGKKSAQHSVQRIGFHAWLQGFVFGATTALLVVAVEIANR